MRTTVVLIRHAAYPEAGRRFTGRSPGHALSPEGRAQAEGLIARLERFEFTALYSSPVQRALETAAPLANARGLDVQTLDEFAEVDTGEWTGRTFESLSGDQTFARFNAERSKVTIPGGEHFRDVQARVGRGLELLAARHANETIAVFTHADILRVALVNTLGMPLDYLLRLDVELTNVSVVETGLGGSRLLAHGL